MVQRKLALLSQILNVLDKRVGIELYFWLDELADSLALVTHSLCFESCLLKLGTLGGVRGLLDADIGVRLVLYQLTLRQRVRRRSASDGQINSLAGVVQRLSGRVFDSHVI